MQRKRPKKTANKRTEYIAARSYAYPVYQTWLIDTLAKAYSDRVFILGVIGDIARLIRRRQKQKREASNTTCIACGGWIPKEREERRQHTCSDNCQQWYRRLTRAIDAGRECRYCGRGLPKDRQKWPKRRRPGRPRGLRQRVEIKPGKTLGAPRRNTPMIPLGSKPLVLVPNARDGMDLEAISDALEENRVR
jgi:hypothetical protein